MDLKEYTGNVEKEWKIWGSSQQFRNYQGRDV